MTTDQPIHKAGEPSGLTWPAEVECQKVGPHYYYCNCKNGRIPNPAIFQTCETCGGSGRIDGRMRYTEAKFSGPCPDCDGQGVTPRTVRVAEAVQVVEHVGRAVEPHCIIVSTGKVWLAEFTPDGPNRWEGQDITHLWPEKPCPECKGAGGWTVPYGIDRPPGWDDCDVCQTSGTVRPLPQPGEWWIVGYREAVLGPLVLGEVAERVEVEP